MNDSKTDWRADRFWANERRCDVQEILGRHLALLSEVRFVTDEEDAKQATDLVVESAAGTVACRIRDTTRDFRDWTVRSRRRSGAKTELAKLKEGFARWYFYGWAKPPDARIGDYVLIDLDRVRACGLLDADRKERTGDGWETAFIAISVDELRLAACLLVDECKSRCTHARGNYVPAPSVKRTPVPDAEPPKPAPRGLVQGDLFVKPPEPERKPR